MSKYPNTYIKIAVNWDQPSGHINSSEHRCRSALPPLAQPYHHAYSRSLNAMANSPPGLPLPHGHHSLQTCHQQQQQSAAAVSNQMFPRNEGGVPPPVLHHRAAKSCDFDMMGQQDNYGPANKFGTATANQLAAAAGMAQQGQQQMMCQQQQPHNFFPSPQQSAQPFAE
jgi:hypothetical protein